MVGRNYCYERQSEKVSIDCGLFILLNILASIISNFYNLCFDRLESTLFSVKLSSNAFLIFQGLFLLWTSISSI